MERKCRLMVIGTWICLGLPLIVSEATAQIRISKSSLTIDEGGKGFYKLHLNAPPSAEITLDITTTNSDVRVKPESLTFTPDDWDKARKITVEAIRDADAEDDHAIISHSVRTASNSRRGAANLQAAFATAPSSLTVIVLDQICAQPRSQYQPLLRPFHPKGRVWQLQCVIDRETRRFGDRLGLKRPERRQSISFLAEVLRWNLEQHSELYRVGRR